jgi:hypothetical protein
VTRALARGAARHVRARGPRRVQRMHRTTDAQTPRTERQSTAPSATRRAGLPTLLRIPASRRSTLVGTARLRGNALRERSACTRSAAAPRWASAWRSHRFATRSSAYAAAPRRRLSPATIRMDTRADRQRGIALSHRREVARGEVFSSEAPA